MTKVTLQATSNVSGRKLLALTGGLSVQRGAVVELDDGEEIVKHLVKTGVLVPYKAPEPQPDKEPDVVKPTDPYAGKTQQELHNLALDRNLAVTDKMGVKKLTDMLRADDAAKAKSGEKADI